MINIFKKEDFDYNDYNNTAAQKLADLANQKLNAYLLGPLDRIITKECIHEPDRSIESYIKGHDVLCKNCNLEIKPEIEWIVK